MDTPETISDDSTHTECNHSGLTLRLIAEDAVQHGEYGPACGGYSPAPHLYRRLANGCDKVVIELGCSKHVLKTYHKRGSRYAVQQVHREYDNYVNARPSLRRRLVPILAASAEHDYLLVTKVEPYKGDGWNRIQRIEAFASRHGVGDIHPGNLGFAGKRLLILDYGWPAR